MTIKTMYFVDSSRSIRFANGRVLPRPLTTYVRYPRTQGGRLPLLVFGHGFASTPAIYARLLTRWAQAGYVVAAPLFPLSNAQAPGGPRESDIVNQPRDVSFIISRLLAASAGPAGPLAGRIDPGRIAVAGHSDGGLTAFAIGYDPRYRDTRVDAVALLSAAPVLGRGFKFLAAVPPALLTQGGADTINPARDTDAYYRIAPRPKFLLSLTGAQHLPPYTNQLPQLDVVEQVTLAFFDHYLKHGSLTAIRRAASHPGTSSLLESP